MNHDQRPIDDDRWQAVLAHDATADGSFCYAVTTTGIYCRPSCPSRRPHRENAIAFDDMEEATRAGYRPCRRCRPNEVDPRQRTVARVRSLLETREPAPSLRDLAATVGMSPFHLQRVFKQATGLSPKQYAMAHRTRRLKAHLKEGDRVTEAMYGAGYGSSHALYADIGGRLGMTPSAYRQGGDGEQIAYAVTETRLGRMLVAATERGVCAVRFGEDDALLGELRQEFPRAVLRHDPNAVASFMVAASTYLDDRSPAPSLPLDLAGTDFQRRVWDALATIPRGETRSYRQVAEMIGQPSAARAVARACATNPIAMIVPCHRVVRADGGLGGYRWGLPRKEQLLAWESTPAPPAEVGAERERRLA